MTWRKAFFTLFAKTIASFKSVCLWTPFLVNLGPFTRISLPSILEQFLGRLVLRCHLR
jgi:hypothetical protein